MVDLVANSISNLLFKLAHSSLLCDKGGLPQCESFGISRLHPDVQVVRV